MPPMESLLLERRIRLWEMVCHHYSIPKGRVAALDKAIRAGEEPQKPGRKPNSAVEP